MSAQILASYQSSIIFAVSSLTLMPIWGVVLKLLQLYLRDRHNAQQPLAVSNEPLEAVLNSVLGSISRICFYFLFIISHIASACEKTSDASCSNFELRLTSNHPLYEVAVIIKSDYYQ